MKEKLKKKDQKFFFAELPQVAFINIMSFLTPKEFSHQREVNTFFYKKMAESEFLKTRLMADVKEYFNYQLSADELDGSYVNMEIFKVVVTISKSLVHKPDRDSYVQAFEILKGYFCNDLNKIPELILFLYIKLQLLGLYYIKPCDLPLDFKSIIDKVYQCIGELQSRLLKRQQTLETSLNYIETEIQLQQLHLLDGNKLNKDFFKLVANHWIKKNPTQSYPQEDFDYIVNYFSRHSPSILDLMRYRNAYEMLEVFFVKNLSQLRKVPPHASLYNYFNYLPELLIIHLLSFSRLDATHIPVLNEITIELNLLKSQKDEFLLSKFVILFEDCSKFFFSQLTTTEKKAQMFKETKKEDFEKNFIIKVVDDYYELRKTFNKDYNLNTFKSTYPSLTNAITHCIQLIRLLKCSTQQLEKLNSFMSACLSSSAKKKAILFHPDCKVLQMLTIEEINGLSTRMLVNLYQYPEPLLIKMINDFRVLSKEKDFNPKVNTIKSLSYVNRSDTAHVISNDTGKYKRKYETIEEEIFREAKKNLSLQEKIKKLKEQLQSKDMPEETSSSLSFR